MRALQAFIVEPHRAEVREVDLPDPASNQILVRTVASAVSAGTELAVWGGTHQWLKDPTMTDWKFPFRPGYSAAGEIVAVGRDGIGWQAGDRVSYPGNHASAELLTIGHERGKLWKLPAVADFEKTALACIARYGFGAAIRSGITLGRSVAVLGLGVIGQFALRSFKAAGAFPVTGIDSVKMRRDAAMAGGADDVLDLAQLQPKQRLAEIVVDATGNPNAIPTAMSLTHDAGQVIVVGSPRGRANDVNFYDDLHRRYIEVSGAHGNMLFEQAHTRIPGAWTLEKAQHWLLAAITDGRLNLDGLVTHTIAPDGLAAVYEGLQNKKEEYLGVVVRWS